MSARDVFGPNLRRIRIQRGISLDQIAAETKVPKDLWERLERNDFERWPTGIFARAYIREYARLIGVDAEATVDQFCRWFPNGDRRILRVVSEQARIVGHDLEWREQLPPEAGDTDRRGAPPAPPHATADPTTVSLFLRLRRVLGKA